MRNSNESVQKIKVNRIAVYQSFSLFFKSVTIVSTKFLKKTTSGELTEFVELNKFWTGVKGRTASDSTTPSIDRICWHQA